MSKEYLSVFFF